MTNTELKQAAHAFMTGTGLFERVEDVRLAYFEDSDRLLALAVVDGEVQHDCVMFCGGWQRTIFTEGS